MRRDKAVGALSQYSRVWKSGDGTYSPPSRGLILVSPRHGMSPSAISGYAITTFILAPSRWAWRA